MYFLVAGQDLNLRPSGHEPDEISGFPAVFRRIANVSQINFAQAFVSQMCRESAPTQAIFHTFFGNTARLLERSYANKPPKVRALKSSVLRFEILEV